MSLSQLLWFTGLVFVIGTIGFSWCLLPVHHSLAGIFAVVLLSVAAGILISFTAVLALARILFVPMLAGVGIMNRMLHSRKQR